MRHRILNRPKLKASAGMDGSKYVKYIVLECWLRLHPMMFGHPNSRPRSWRICYDKKLKKWTSEKSLQELATALLADPKSQPPVMSFESYLFDRVGSSGVQIEDGLAQSLASK